MATVGGKSLGIVQTEDQTKESNLFFFPLPYSDSNDAILMDLMGTSRTITVSGHFVNTDKSTLQANVIAIEGIQNGQQGTAVYVGDFITTNKNVQIQTFNWTWNEADVQRVSYTLTMLEGSAI